MTVLVRRRRRERRHRASGAYWTRTLRPAPPVRTSTPAPPSRRSAPAPPSRRSRPAPPRRRSAPASPSRRSAPAPPLSASAPRAAADQVVAAEGVDHVVAAQADDHVGLGRALEPVAAVAADHRRRPAGAARRGRPGDAAGAGAAGRRGRIRAARRPGGAARPRRCWRRWSPRRGCGRRAGSRAPSRRSAPPRSTVARPSPLKVVSGRPLGWKRITRTSSCPRCPASDDLPVCAAAATALKAPGPATAVPSSEKPGSGSPVGPQAHHDRRSTAVADAGEDDRPVGLHRDRGSVEPVRADGDRDGAVARGAEGGVEGPLRVEQARDPEAADARCGREAGDDDLPVRAGCRRRSRPRRPARAREAHARPPGAAGVGRVDRAAGREPHDDHVGVEDLGAEAPDGARRRRRGRRAGRRPRCRVASANAGRKTPFPAAERRGRACRRGSGGRRRTRWPSWW